MISFQNESLNILVQLLEEADSASPFTSWQDKTMSYYEFRRMARDPRLPQEEGGGGLLVRVLFHPRTFMSLPKDATGAIFMSMLFDYALEYRAQRLLRLDLAEIDQQGTNHLTEQQMLRFVQRTCEDRAKIPPGQLTSYPLIVTRKLMFLLKQPSQRIPIRTLLASPMLQELKDALRDTNPVENWFSPSHMADLEFVFHQLDVDGNGTLSRDEFSKVRLGRLNYHPSVTSLVVNRIFECKLNGGTGGGEMDLLAFLDFVLASQNKHYANAQRYFWDVMDLHNEGYLSRFTLLCLLREVRLTAVHTGYAYEDQGVTVESVCNEVFDLFPERSQEDRIMFDEFKRNKPSASIVITLLTDPNGFVDYDTREARLQQKQQSSLSYGDDGGGYSSSSSELEREELSNVI